MKYLFYGLIVVVIGGVGFWFLGQGSNDVSLQEASVVKTTQTGQVLKFSASITGRKYDPVQIDVPFGAEVELTVKNNDNEQHGLVIADFGVQEFVGPRQTKTVRFIADKRGAAATFCSVAHPEKLIINVY